MLLFSWLPTGTYQKKSGNWETFCSLKPGGLGNFFFSKSGEFGLFFPWTILCIGRDSYFSG